jgi:hypothetical protein
MFKKTSGTLPSQDPIAIKQDEVHMLPWAHFLKKLWDGDII